MTTAALTNAGGASTQIGSGRHQRPDVCDADRALWAMTRDERIAAMWRGELTTGQLCQWSSRAQHEVPLLAGELDRDAHTRLGRDHHEAGADPVEVDP
jgi:hypothetical protein